MANYTKEEIEQFRKKDKRISMQGLVQSIISAKIFTDKEVVEMQLPLALAKKYSEAIHKLAEGSEVVAEEETETKPQLTVQQKRVFDLVKKQIDSVSIADVLRWSQSVGHEGIFPQNSESVKKIVEFLKNGTNS